MKPRALIAFSILSAVSACASLTPQDGLMVSENARAIGGGLYIEEAQDRSFLMLDGRITPDTSDLFQAMFSEADINGLVILQSPGGDPIAAHQIGRTIRNYNINTLVVGACFSACVDIFAAGVQRTLSEGGVLGLHSWATERPPEQAIAIAQRYWSEMGYPPSIMNKAFTVPHEQIWIIEPKRARELRLATQIYATGERSTP